MDVVNAEQAKIAEAAGAIAVMALERVPSDIRAEGGVARMANPSITEEVMDAVSIPVMAKGRIGHIVEARVLEAMGVDYIDESEVLSPADDIYHIMKSDFKVPFVCGCRNLGEATRRIGEGSAMLRTKGEPGTGNIVEAVRHLREIRAEIGQLLAMSNDEVMTFAKNTGSPYEILMDIRGKGRLPRSEEHTSELQSRGHLVCRLLLEKKKQEISRRAAVSSHATPRPSCRRITGKAPGGWSGGTPEHPARRGCRPSR